MSSCCAICYRESVGNVAVSKQKVDEFFRFFVRYLGGAEKSEMGSHFKKNQFSGIGMVSCGECMPLMEGFCELYHQLKSTEILINWKVETLKNVMRCAHKVPLRVTNLRNFVGTIEAPEKYQDLINSRRWLIKKCSKKMRRALPKLSIAKLRSDERGTSTELLETEEGNNARNIFSESSVFNKNQLELNSLQVSAQAQGYESACAPKTVTMDKTILPNSSDNADEDDITDPGGTSIAGANQIDPHSDGADDPTSTHGSDKGSGRDLSDDDENAKLLKCPPLRIKIEPVDKTKPAMKRNVDITCTSRDISQIKLENPPELATDLASSDTDLTSEEPHTKQVSRPRLTHRCQHCGTSFSTAERLQLHIQQEHRIDQSDDQVLASDSDNDQNQIEDNDAEMDIDSSCFSSSSSGEDNLESDNGPSKSKSKTNKNSSRKHRQPRRNLERGAQLRFKCPDCSILVDGIRSFLLHRKTSKSCGHSQNPSASTKVEILTLSKDNMETGATLDLDDSNFVDVFALVDLPTEIYICDICDVAVYSFEDTETHKKLHSSFKCAICKVTKSYAPDLALHESQTHHVPKNKMRANGKRKHCYSYNCVRCGFGSESKNVYIGHHLSDHLSLTFNEPKCAICKTNSEWMTVSDDLKGNKYWKFQVGPHLKTHHDLRNVDNVEDLKRCKAETCSAYFLTTEQLTEHQKLRHIPKNKLVKCSFVRARAQSAIQPYYRLKCPDCNNLFQSSAELLNHRKSMDSCSGSYDPLQSVKVELLIRPGASNKNLDGDATAFTTVHAILVFPQAIFVCDIDDCGTVQYSSEDMEVHKKLHGTFICNFCKSEHSSAPKLSIHELQHSKKEKTDRNYSSTSTVYACPRCDFRCARLTIYVRHHVSSHLALTLNEPICPICKTHHTGLSVKPSSHADHFKNVHDLSDTIPGDIQKCTISNCDAYFLSSNQLSNHLWFRHNIGSGGSGRRPQHQQQNSDNPSSEQSSKRVEVGEKEKKQAGSHKCKDCGKTYKRLDPLWDHRIKHHVALDKVIPCTFPKCDKVFESSKQLNQHLRHGTKYHRSLDCPIVQCPKCNKSISAMQPHFLAAHMKTHEVSHFCELCGKVFNKKRHLQTHYKSHSGPDSWEFMCSVCSKKCLTKPKLDEHMRIHTQDKPFVCETCGAKYAHGHNLRIHVKNKHGDEVEVGDASKPRKAGTSNLMTKKGVKRKRTNNAESESDESDTDNE